MKTPVTWDYIKSRWWHRLWRTLWIGATLLYPFILWGITRQTHYLGNGKFEPPEFSSGESLGIAVGGGLIIFTAIWCVYRWLLWIIFGKIHKTEAP